MFLIAAISVIVVLMLIIIGLMILLAIFLSRTNRSNHDLTCAMITRIELIKEILETGIKGSTKQSDDLKQEIQKK